jgi:hypothetical protein
MKKLTLILLLGTLVVSCNKSDPPKEGCTDPEALNYNSTAEVDDGSCIYPDTTTFATSIIVEDIPGEGANTAGLKFLVYKDGSEVENVITDDYSTFPLDTRLENSVLYDIYVLHGVTGEYLCHAKIQVSKSDTGYFIEDSVISMDGAYVYGSIDGNHVLITAQV